MPSLSSSSSASARTARGPWGRRSSPRGRGPGSGPTASVGRRLAVLGLAGDRLRVEVLPPFDRLPDRLRATRGRGEPRRQLHVDEPEQRLDQHRTRMAQPDEERVRLAGPPHEPEPGQEEGGEVRDAPLLAELVGGLKEGRLVGARETDHRDVRVAVRVVEVGQGEGCHSVGRRDELTGRPRSSRPGP